jgi:hypothetical protein
MMMKEGKKNALIAAAILGGVLAPCLFAEKAQAIPAFSRQYKKECVTCHTMYPERNEYGEAFEKNGYYPPEGVPAAAPAPMALTTEKGKRVVLDPLSAAGIPAQVPVSIWAQTDITYNKHNPAKNGSPQLDFARDPDLDLMAAGNFLGKVGYWADYSFADKEVGEVFAQFQKVLGLPLNVKVERFEPKTSLWKSNNNPMIASFGHLAANVDHKFDFKAAPPAVTEDANFTLDSAQSGVEVNGVVLPRLFVATGVTNGFNKTTNAKDWYGHVSTKIGGADFKGTEPDIDLEHANLLDEFCLTLGGYSYVGSSNDSTNDYYRVGLDAELMVKQLKLKVGALYGKDDSPRNTDPALDLLPTKSRLGFGQLEYQPDSAVLASLRYEIQDIEHQGVTRRIIPSLAYTPVQNVKLILEYASQNGAAGNDDQTSFRVSCAF